MGDLIFPAELTPALRHVLGLMNFRTCPIAHLFQAAGHDIPRKTEEEQAFVLHWLIGLVLRHGDDWPEAAEAKITELRAEVSAKKIALNPDSDINEHA